jgi:DNA repair exonuclease SbcCD nuclease subunit
MKIVHIADVHWRGLSRHSEYRKVFDQFVLMAKEQHIDHIFVGGDIFHTKTSGISPEFIDELKNWLTQLSSVAEVHMILGNHDGSLANTNRQDAITPIVELLNDPRVHLYKQSGVYKFAPNYNWCVYSLFDVQGWNKVAPVPGEINIACYHGPVKGAVLGGDLHVVDGISVEFFKGYDFVFLGDLHTRQYLDFREVELTIDETQLQDYPDAVVLGECT